MKKILKLVLILFILFMACNACNKDEEKLPEHQKQCYITKAVYDNYHSEEFLYNSEDRLQKMITVEDGGRDTQTYEFVYDNAGRVVKALQDEKGISYTLFYYNADNTISRMEMVYSNVSQGLPYQAASFEYNSNKKLRKATISGGPYNTSDFMYIEYFYDTKGNIINQKVYGIDEFTKEWKLQLNVTSEFDDKRNPLYEIKIPPLNYKYFAFSKNNPIKQSSWSENSTWVISGSIQYTSEGYPGKIRFRDQDGSFYSTTYLYNCK